MVLHFYERFLFHPNGTQAAHHRRVKFSSQFFGGKATFPSPASNPTTPGVVYINEPSLFKRKLPLLPVISAEQFY